MLETRRRRASGEGITAARLVTATMRAPNKVRTNIRVSPLGVQAPRRFRRTGGSDATKTSDPSRRFPMGIDTRVTTLVTVVDRHHRRSTRAQVSACNTYISRSE
jgi:hypothetical protein